MTVVRLDAYRSTEELVENGAAPHWRAARQKLDEALAAFARNEPLTAGQRSMIFLAARSGQRAADERQQYADGK